MLRRFVIGCTARYHIFKENAKLDRNRSKKKTVEQWVNVSCFCVFFDMWVKKSWIYSPVQVDDWKTHNRKENCMQVKYVRHRLLLYQTIQNVNFVVVIGTSSAVHFSLLFWNRLFSYITTHINTGILPINWNIGFRLEEEEE